jgi:microcystin-dependent protein
MLGWTVEVRDSSLVRVGQLSENDLTAFLAIPRMNSLGSWSIRLPNTVLDASGVRVPHALCAVLRTQGSGVIFTGPHGVVLTGPMTFAEMEATSDDPSGQWTIEGTSDVLALARPTAFPQPSNSNPATQTVSNDVRTGLAEALMRSYVSANIGPAASSERQLPDLSLAADGGLGISLSKSPRFQNLLELTQEISLGSDLLFDVVQVADGREFRVSAPQDVSSLVRWDIANNQLSKSKYGYSAPGVTRVFVAGQGEGTERTIVEVTTPASLLSEAIWGRIERFVDQRNTDDISELTQAGLEVLATEGTTVTSLEVVPSSAMADGFGVDWFLGSWVTVVVNDQQIRAQVVEVPISITSSDGVLVGAVVGDATGFDWQAILAAKQSKTDKRVSALEQNAENGSGAVPPGAVQEFAGSTAPYGFLLCDGSLVSRTTYATLFAVLGVVFGAGDGSTTFALPNHAGRVAAGKGTGTFATLGATGGAETVTLTAAEMPSHTHTQNAHSHDLRRGEYGNARREEIALSSGGSAQTSGAGIFSATATNQNTGGGGAHNNLQPFIVLNFIIKT